jgi:DNA-binding LytR/AlgR family response regulator
MSNSNEKILVIDNDQDFLKKLKEILKKEGFIVKTKLDGKSGIKTAVDWRPNLIICDISIPLKNGYEVLQAILASSITKATPFIFLTAKTKKEDFRKGMQLGADDYLFKPYDINDLLVSIKMRLEKSILGATASLKEIENTNKLYGLDDKIYVKKGSEMQLFILRDLIYLSAESPYAKLNFVNGKHSFERKSMLEWERKLPTKYFMRIHRSTIINKEYITKIEKLKNTSYKIWLKDELKSFVTSKRYSSKIKTHFST